jgi:F0F1-type ATP synthase membrane subunit a
MKTIFIILGVACLLCFIISIPMMEEKEYDKTHPEHLQNSYNLFIQQKDTIVKDTISK